MVKLSSSGKSLILPAIVGGAAGLALLYVTQQGKHYKKHHPPLPPHMMRPRGPVAVSHVVEGLKHDCHQYIRNACVDKSDAHRKRGLINASLSEHCHRLLPKHIAAGSHPRKIQHVCEGICEKVCNQLNIHLKPRCSTSSISNMYVGQHLPIRLPSLIRLPRYHAHALYGRNIFDLDYNHAPTPNFNGRLF